MFGIFKSKKQKDAEFLRTMVKAYAEGEQRTKLNVAISSLDIQLEPEQDDSQYCTKASAAIVKKVLEKYGTKLAEASDDDIVTAGVFLFTVVNHITLVMSVDFEIVASIAPLELFYGVRDPVEMVGYVGVISDTYNNAIQNSKIIDAIGQNIVKWIDMPTLGNFDRLVQLYEICRKGIKNI